jgi:hypothetical protein
LCDNRLWHGMHDSQQADTLCALELGLIAHVRIRLPMQIYIPRPLNHPIDAQKVFEYSKTMPVRLHPPFPLCYKFVPKFVPI